MDIKHLIISLPGERRDFVKNQLLAINLNCEIVEAISGNELREAGQFASVPSNYVLESEMRSWNHFACHLSWIKALQKAKRSNYEKFVIYEDDCLLSNDYESSLYRVEKELPVEWVFVNLGVRELQNLNLLPEKQYLAELNGTVTGMQSVLFNGVQINRVLYQLLGWKNWVQILSPKITFPKFATYPALTTQSVDLPTNIRN